METLRLTNGTRQVIATRNDRSSKWVARLYVNNGETATLKCGKFQTVKGLTNWASKVLVA